MPLNVTRSPPHVKTKDLDFYVLKGYYGGPKTIWTLWMDGHEVDAEGKYDESKSWTFSIKDKVYELNPKEVPSPYAQEEMWIKFKTTDKTKNISGWVRYEHDNLAKFETVYEEKIDQLKNSWKNLQKAQFISWPEALSRIEKNDRFDFLSAYRPRIVKNITYPTIAFYYLKFEDSESRFKFNSCAELTDLFRKSFPLKKIGKKPFEVRYNNFFIDTDSSYKSEVFLQNCLALTENNTYECPSYVTNYESVIGKVGPLLSIEYGYMGGAGCGPSYSQTKVKTIDLRTGEEAKIADFFENEEVQQALTKDPFVQEKMANQKNKGFDKIKELLQLGGFSIYEPTLYQDKVRIRWTTEIYECGMCSNSYSTVGMDLKPTSWFAAELKKINPKDELYFSASEKK